MNVLVTGATGAVGPCVVQALCLAGHAIRSFSLDRALPGAFPLSVDERFGDVTDPAAVQSAMQGVDAVVHLADLPCLTPCQEQGRRGVSPTNSK